MLFNSGVSHILNINQRKTVCLLHLMFTQTHYMCSSCPGQRTSSLQGLWNRLVQERRFLSGSFTVKVVWRVGAAPPTWFRAVAPIPTLLSLLIRRAALPWASTLPPHHSTPTAGQQQSPASGLLSTPRRMLRGRSWPETLWVGTRPWWTFLTKVAAGPQWTWWRVSSPPRSSSLKGRWSAAGPPQAQGGPLPLPEAQAGG